MSDTAQGPDWWLASDNKWYPPDQQPGVLPPPPGGAVPQTYTAAPSTNGFAIAALVLGIVWVWGVGSILALIFGYKARREIDASGGRQGGRGMAIAGIVLGWIGCVGVVLLMMSIFVLGSSAESKFTDVGNQLGGVNSDFPDGSCDYDRYLQDPDC